MTLSKLNYLPRSPSPNTNTLGVRASTCESLGQGTNIQSIAFIFVLKFHGLDQVFSPGSRHHALAKINPALPGGIAPIQPFPEGLSTTQSNRRPGSSSSKSRIM